MAIHNGYIRVWRKIKNNPIYANSKAVHIWLECLIRATYQEREFYQGREKIELDPGQFIMGYREFAKDINSSPSTVKYWMDNFEKDEDMIERTTNAKGTIVSIKNWSDYQEVERTPNACRTPAESNNKVKKDKEGKKEYSGPRLKEIQEVHRHWLDKCSDLNEAKLTKDQKKRIDTKIDKWSVEDIKTAIDHYREVYDSDFYYSNTWTLRRFVKQGNGIPRFKAGLDQEYDSDIWKDYQKRKNQDEDSDEYDYNTV